MPAAQPHWPYRYSVASGLTRWPTQAAPVSFCRMYFVVIGVFSLVLAFTAPPAAWVLVPERVILTAAVVALLPAAVALYVTRRVLRLLERHPADPGHGQFAYGRGVFLVQSLIAVGQVGLMLFTNWLPLCRAPFGSAPWPLLPGLLACVPLLLSMVLVWIALYPADRAVRQIALEVFLFRGKPAHPVWSLPRYLEYNFRHQVLFVLIPMCIILAVRDAVQFNDAGLRQMHPFLPDLLLGVTAGVVAIIAPVILRYAWVTQPLPPGPLRDRLLALSRRLKMRFREILVWRSGGMIVNAAVMGVLAPLRYLMITDAMLEQMDDVKIEAVFGHEAGHVKRRHILFFLLLAFTTGCIVSIVSAKVEPLPRAAQDTAFAALGGLLILKWGLLFGWISRRFENQADIYGVRTLTLAGLPCRNPCLLHQDVAARPGDAPHRLCSTAAHVFGDTLNEVAVLNGIPPEAHGWRHPSISSRSRFLQKLAGDPGATRRFELAMAWVQAAILIASVALAIWAAAELRLWRLVAPLLALLS